MDTRTYSRTADREELLENSDTRSSTVGDDKAWTAEDFRRLQAPKQPKFLSLLKEYWWLYTTALLIIIAGLQFVIWRDLKELGSGGAKQVGGDVYNQGPIFPTEIVQWRADPEFTPLNATEFLDPRIQAKWETLLPPGAGFAGGPDSIVTYNSTSVTHQLHCVYIMGKIFAGVLTKAASIAEPDDYEAHFLHCVDYMRQAAMCAGDLTLEPRGVNGMPAEVTLENAFNGLHVCKDYGHVKGYLEDQLLEGKRNILPLDD